MPITNRFLEPQADGRRDEITSYSLDVDQNFDNRTGKPTGRPTLSHLTIRITRDSEEDAPFYVEWQFDPTRTENLDITFYDNNQLKRSIKIKDAFLVSYNQDSNEPGTIEETLVLSPQSIEVDGVTFDRRDYQ